MPSESFDKITPTRRQFLKTAVAGAATLLAPAAVLASHESTVARDRRTALILDDAARDYLAGTKRFDVRNVMRPC